jgi:hypothetical protein
MLTCLLLSTTLNMSGSLSGVWIVFAKSLQPDGKSLLIVFDGFGVVAFALVHFADVAV